MSKSHLQIANELEEPHLSDNMKRGSRPANFYTGYISGVEFTHSIRWWVILKEKIDPRPISKSTLYNRLKNTRVWTAEESLATWSGESLTEYRFRIGGEVLVKKKPKKDPYTMFATRALI